MGKGLSNHRHGFRPQYTLSRNAGFGSRVVDDAAVQVHDVQGQAAAIAISESAIDAEQDHGFEALSGRVQQAADFFGGEQLRPLLGLVDAQRFLAGALEMWAIANGPIDEAGVEGVLARAADALNRRSQPMRSVALGQFGAN